MAEASTQAQAQAQAQIPQEQAVARSRRSSVWEHFTHLTEVDGDGKIKAECNHCHGKLLADPKHGTTHLRRHVNTCRVRRQELDQSPPQTTLPCSAPTPTTLPRTDHPSPFPRDLPHESYQLAVSPRPSSVPPSSLSNDLATLSFHDDDHGLQSLPQTYYQPSLSTSSFPVDLPPAPPQPCIDSPPLVPQTVPYDLQPQPPVPCPPSSHSDDQQVLPDREHGHEDDEEASNHLAQLIDDEELPDSEHFLVEEAAAARKHLLARLIALHGYDPALVEDDCFRSFVGSLNPKFKLPSRLAIEELCDGIFEEARKDMLSRLPRLRGKVSLAVGTTKTVHGEVLYTACHFIDDQWKLHQMILDAYLLAPFPFFYGPLLGAPEVTFKSDLSELGLLEFSLEYYGQAVDDVLSGILEYNLGSPFVIVLGIDSKMERQMDGVTKRLALDRTRYMDNDLHTIAGIFTILYQYFINDMYKKVHGLGLTREKRQQLFSLIGLDHLRAYDHHWYSCYCSLEFLRKHGSCTIADKDCSQLIEVLCKILGVIYRAIQRNSTCSYPTSNQCLVDLLKVREILQSELKQNIDAGNNSIGYNVFITHGNVADALRKAMITLDITFLDSFLVWSVPLVLDPRYKLTHIKSIFSRAFGPADGARYIFEVTRKIKKLYADYIEYDGRTSDGVDSDGEYDGGTNDGADSDGVNEAAAGSSADPFGQTWDEHCLSGDVGMDDVGSDQECREEFESSSDGRTDAGSYLDAEKELDRYLNDPCENPIEGFDILNWWKANSCKYPTVARLARDALAMPTCSKLSSEQMAHVSSIIRGYSKKKYRQPKYES